MLLKKISFNNFRGLPSNSISLDGKNALIIGGNGKGKTSIVDGLELFFSSDFAKPSKALKHIKSSSDPKIIFLSKDSKEVICSINSANDMIVWSPADKGIFKNHPLPQNFILRRKKIIALIESSPSERFRYIMDLLGEEQITEKRRLLQEAVKLAKENQHSAHTALLNHYQSIVIGVIRPNSVQEVIDYINKMLKNINIAQIISIDNILSVKDDVEKKLQSQHIESYREITNAIEILKAPYRGRVTDLFQIATESTNKVKRLESALTDGHKSIIINNAILYFEKNENDISCPVCGQEISPTTLLLQLKAKKQILNSLNEAISERKNALNALKELIDSKLLQFKREYAICQQYMDENLKSYYSISIADHILASQNIENGMIMPHADYDKLIESSTNVYQGKYDLLKTLQERQEGLLQSYNTDVKKVYDIIILFGQLAPQIVILEKKYHRYSQIYLAVENARQLIEKSCNEGLIYFLDSFSQEIGTIYSELHDSIDITDEQSECTDIKLIPIRGRSSLMHLSIDFLNAIETKEPELYLSEGHLDSLGLSIFLASALKFNPKGSLIVLDDVLTSIDRDHKHRVASLLVNKFIDYQLIITTHDESWARDLIRFTESYSVKKNWKHIHVSKWDIDSGPFTGDFKTIEEKAKDIDEANYKDNGAILRQLSESFITEFVAGMQMLVPYAHEKRFTVESFCMTSKINKNNEKTKSVLKMCRDNDYNEPNNIEKLLCHALATEFNSNPGIPLIESQRLMGMIFISTGETLNILSHFKPDDDVSFSRIKDFISSILKVRNECEQRGLLKKYQWH